MKPPRSLAIKALPLALFLALPSLAPAQTFTPIPLTPSSFNESIVIPSNWLYKLNNQSVTVTIDHGPCLETINVTGFPTYYSIDSGDTFFEQGLERTSGTTLGYGLPHGGTLLTNVTTINSGTFSNHIYQLPFWTNWNSNCVCICPYTNGATYNSQPLVAGPYTYPTNNPYYNPRLALNNSSPFSALSLLCSGGGPHAESVTIQYADGSSQGPVNFTVPNWFVNSAVDTAVTPNATFAFTAAARCNPSENNNAFNQNSGVTSGSRLWSIDIALNNTNSPATNLVFTCGYTQAANGTTAADVIIAVSGSHNTNDNLTVPNTAALIGPFAPIPVSGYNAGFCVANSSNTLAGLAPLTATMDNGTNLNGGANTWFEIGWDPAAPTNGFPAHGSTINSAAFPSRSYQMPASYNQPMSTLVDTNHQVVNITPQTPTNFTALSLLTCGASIGNGNRMTNIIILQHSDGVNETNIFIGYDWFESSQTPAYVAAERCNVGTSGSTTGREVQNLYSGFPRMFDSEFQLYDAIAPVTNIQIQYYNPGNHYGANWTTYVLAVSASTNPIPAGAVASYTPAQNVFAGHSATFSVTHGFGSSLAYQWQYTDGATFTNNLSDGPSSVYDSSATISGSLTPTLTIGNVGSYDLSISNASGTNIYYTCLITNAIPSSTNSPLAVLSLLQATGTNVLAPGDVLVDYYNSAPPGETLGEAYPSPVGLLLTNVEDGTLAAYLNYGASGGNTSFSGPVGFMVTPQAGATVVNALRFYAAVNASICDPADFALAGSTDGGNTWTPIVADTLLSLPNERNLVTSLAVNVTNQILQEVDFTNSTPYTTYALTVQNVKGIVQGSPTTPNSMQIAEIQFIGSQAQGLAPDIIAQPTPTNKTLLAGGHHTVSGLRVGGVTPFYYQWYWINAGVTNGVPNATNSTLVLSNVPVSGSGPYFCVVSNLSGAIASSNVYLTVLPATPLYEATVMGDQPLAYWRLDEGNGLSSPQQASPNGTVLANDYAGDLDGVYTNTYIGEHGYSSNDVDTAANFGEPNSVPYNSYVGSVPAFNNFVANTNQPAQFSVEAWVQNYSSAPQSIGGAGIVTFGYGGGGEQFALDCGSTSNAYRFYFRDATLGTNVFNNPSHNANAPANAENDGADGNWHHVVGVLNSQNSSNNANYLYVDGLMVASNGLGTNLLGVQYGAAPELTIGARCSNNITTNFLFQFNGNIDEVAIYPYALSSAQVLNHYYSAGIAPFFTPQPTNETVSQGSTATIVAGARGTPNLNLQWYQVLPGGTTNKLVNGPSPYGTISGATNTTLVIADTQVDPNGQDAYVLVAANAYATNSSFQMLLNVVNGQPSIIQDLSSSYEFLAGYPFQLAVMADGTQPFTYGWYDNGAPLTNSARISGVNSNVLTVLNAQLSDSGTYQLFITNAYSTPSVGSTPAGVTILPVLGFNGFGGGWSSNANGSFNYGFVSSNVLQVTDGTGNEDSSGFFGYPVYVGAFEASWTYQDVNGASGNTADGACFVIENDPRGAAALGGGGGGLGVTGISPSAELEFNIYPNNAYNGVGYAFSTNGLIQDVTDPYPIDIAGGDAIAVQLTYLNGQLTMNLQDPGPNSPGSYSISIPFSIATAIGTNEAYVGFTGADGGVAATQQISNFTFVSLPSLMASSSSPGSITLSWPIGVGAYVLQQSSSLRSPTWSNVGGSPSIVGNLNQQTVPASTAATYYRLHVQYTPQ